MTETAIHEARPPAAAVETTTEEWTWAALSHLSGVLTLAVSFATAGLGGMLFAFIPLAIYIAYKDKSRFVAYHAAQAVAIQVLGSVGYFMGLIVLTLALALVATVVTILGALLTIILIGVLVLIVAVMLWIIVALFPVVWYVFVPIGLGVLSVIGGVETANGRDYRYPYVGSWTAGWLARHESPALPPAV